MNPQEMNNRRKWTWESLNSQQRRVDGLGENNGKKPSQYNALLDEFQTSNKQDTGEQQRQIKGLEWIHES